MELGVSSMNISPLREIGLTENEIKIYLDLLKSGSSSAYDISKRTGIYRVHIYDKVEQLMTKGLVTHVYKGAKKYFQATDPERVLDYIADKKKNLKKQEEDFKKILPQLKLKQTVQEGKQESKIYVGFEGLKTYYDEILKKASKKDEYLAMTFSDKSLDNKSISLMFQKFHQKRAEKGFKAKILCNVDDKLTQNKMNYSKTGLYEFKTTNQIIPTGIAIFQDIVATYNWGKVPRVFVIICKENADQYRKFFYDLWRSAK